jgi:hypothetical protein
LLGMATSYWTDVRRDGSALTCAIGFTGRELKGVERQTQVPGVSLKALKLQLNERETTCILVCSHYPLFTHDNSYRPYHHTLHLRLNCAN